MTFLPVWKSAKLNASCHKTLVCAIHARSFLMHHRCKPCLGLGAYHVDLSALPFVLSILSCFVVLSLTRIQCMYAVYKRVLFAVGPGELEGGEETLATAPEYQISYFTDWKRLEGFLTCLSENNP